MSSDPRMDPSQLITWRTSPTGWELHNLLEACRAHNWTLCMLPQRDGGLQVWVTRRPGGTHRPQETWSGRDEAEAIAAAWTGIRRWARERAARGAAAYGPDSNVESASWGYADDGAMWLHWRAKGAAQTNCGLMVPEHALIRPDGTRPLEGERFAVCPDCTSGTR